MKEWSLVGLFALASGLASAEPPPMLLVQAAAPAKSPVVALFEDDAEPFIAHLTQIDAPSEATRDDDKFAGVCSVRVTPLQRYNPTIKDWAFTIAEKPGPGQYRYVRFAWKKAGGTGIMIQFHTNRGWEQRYTAGMPTVPWPSLKVANQAPANWEIVTRDLFKDFGALTLTGVALTPMDGTAGFYDHLYLGRTIEDLDKVTNAMLGKIPAPDAPTAEKLRQFWDDLASSDPTVAAPAAAVLAARPVECLPFLDERLRLPALSDKDSRRIALLIDALDANEEPVRERATRELEDMGKGVIKSLREARVLRSTLSLEAHRRIERLLRPYETDELAATPESRQWLQAFRVLERIGTAEARAVLAKVADGTPEASLHREARAAADRLARREK